MKIMVEVFYLRIIKNKVWYQRRQVNLNKRGGDPTTLIESFMQYKLHDSTQKEFVVHSTSWRYARPDKVILTYIAYSDELEFAGRGPKSITLKDLKKINIATGQPRSRTGLERQVVAHAMRHISFLIKTDHADTFKDAFLPQSRKVFKSLWSSLAGRLVLEKQ
jgi:hypothetical protein